MSGIVLQPSLAPYVVPPKYTQESKLMALDFSALLGVGETIVSVNSTSVCVFEGTDPNPDAMISGSSSISGNVVSQLIIGGISGNIYNASILITTSLGQILEGVMQFGVVSVC